MSFIIIHCVSWGHVIYSKSNSGVAGAHDTDAGVPTASPTMNTRQAMDEVSIATTAERDSFSLGSSNTRVH